VSDPSRVVFVVGVSGLLAVVLVGLPLALLDAFTPPGMAVPTIVLWLVFLNLGIRITEPTTRSIKDQPTSLVALAIVAGFVIFAWSNSSEHLLMDRDPGVYFVAGKWLAAEGDLLFQSGLPPEISLSSPDPAARLPQGLYIGPEGTAYFQFQHAPALVMGIANWLGGDWLMFRSAAVVAGLGLLGIYLLARRLSGSIVGLVPLALASIHPAFVHVAKDGYSEMYALGFVMGAFIVWLGRPQSKSSLALFASGMLLGGGTMARIDGWLTAAGFVGGLAYLVVVSGHRAPFTRRQFGALLGGFAVTSGLGILDLVLRSPLYLGDLAPFVVPTMAGLAAFAVVVMVSIPESKWKERLGQLLRRFAPTAAATAVLASGLYAISLRPDSVVARGSEPNPFVGVLQEREGLAVDPFRTYAEMSLEWFTRYQGYLPILVGILAIATATWILLRRKADRRIPVLIVLVVVSVAYLWRPSITPDQLWAMRRFVPVVLPLGFIFTAWIGRLLFRISKWKLVVKSATLGSLTFALVFAGTTGWSVAGVRTQVGVLAAISSFCESLPPSSAVLMDERALVTLPGAIRTMCDVPTGSLEDPNIVTMVREAQLAPVVVEFSRCGGDLPALDIETEMPRTVLSGTPRNSERLSLAASVSVADGSGVSPAVVPDSAKASLQVEVETDWVPTNGFSVLATVGEYRNGMWLEYRDTGALELWVTTSAGQHVAHVVDGIDNNVERAVGGYLEDGVLHATCGDVVVARVPAPGSIDFDTTDITIRPRDVPEVDNQLYEGQVRQLSP
jgi:hypothetical protein